VWVFVHFVSWVLLLYSLKFAVQDLKNALAESLIDLTQATLVVIWASDYVARYWWLWFYPGLFVVAVSTLLTWKLAAARGWLKVLWGLIFSLPLILLVYSALALLGPLIRR
jgi:hypothetical protein